MANPFAETAAVAARSSSFQSGMERPLYRTKSSRQDTSMAKKASRLVSDQIRQAIDDSGLTRYRIAQETGISETTLSLFCSGQRGLPMRTLDTLGEFLELKVTSGRKPEPRGK